MKSFKHYSPATIEEAVSVLKKYNGHARPVAGGTDLYGGLKDDIHPISAPVLVDLKGSRECDHIRVEEGECRIGSLTRLADVEKNPAIIQNHPALAQAAKAVASPQIRNMATVGGNICQEPRCWYYRNPENRFDCHRKGGSRCNALTGDNRFHSVFGAARVVSSACKKACPANTAIPEYLEKMRSGTIKDSARILLRFNPMPAVTGRVCPHFCQSDCNRSFLDTPVSIRNIERFLGDYILENKSGLIAPPSIETGKKVAIIGSGPGGLSAAYYLRRAGHSITVFEEMTEPGGMLTYAIPPYRLPPSVVKNTLVFISETGVDFRLNTKIGKDISLEKIKETHDAVLLATGSGMPVSIGLNGEELAITGLDFLKNYHTGPLNSSGNHVLVIGGGNVAVDVAVTALRQGASSVSMVCLEEREAMPCLEWEIEAAVTEGITLLNGWGPERLRTAQKGKIEAKLIKCVSVFNSENRFSPRFDPSESRIILADRVILAVGQRSDLSYLKGEAESLKINGRIRVDTENQATGITGVYACGDVTSGPATVIEAIASGRRAARTIDQVLTNGMSRIDSEIDAQHGVLPVLSKRFEISETIMPAIETAEKDLPAEDTRGLNRAQVLEEAKRCLNCGCVAVSPSDIAPVLIALDAAIITTKRRIRASDFFQAGVMCSTVLDKDELVTEIKIPSPGSNYYQVFLKYRLRQAIDFAIVSVAVFIGTDRGRISEARIVFGAVAPVPYRVNAVEKILFDSDLNDEIIFQACEAAVENATPLAVNAYKLTIIKALLKRALVEARINIL